MSYVFTASAQFRTVLGNIVEGLTLAGFSPKDYRAINSNIIKNEESIKPVSDNKPIELQLDSDFKEDATEKKSLILIKID